MAKLLVLRPDGQREEVELPIPCTLADLQAALEPYENMAAGVEKDGMVLPAKCLLCDAAPLCMMMGEVEPISELDFWVKAQESNDREAVKAAVQVLTEGDEE